MSFTPGQTLALIAVVAAVTLLTRAGAFLLFPDNRPTPPFISYLGGVLPSAVMAMLVVFCLKGVSPFVYPYGLPELMAGAVVVALHLWRHNNLLSIGAGTALYMVLVQFVFVA